METIVPKVSAPEPSEIIDGDDVDKKLLKLLQAPATLKAGEPSGYIGNYGAYVAMRMNGQTVTRTRFQNCCGPLTGVDNGPDVRIYTYFPAYLVSKEYVQQWINILNMAYGQKCHYAAQMFLADDMAYGGSYLHSKVLSHVVAMDYQPEYKVSKQYTLMKLTFIRYVYYPGHSIIIDSITDMLNEGMNPWDALILAHQHPNLPKTYEGRVGLLFTDNNNGAKGSARLPFRYPRSLEDLSAQLKRYFYINGAFSQFRADVQPQWTVRTGQATTPAYAAFKIFDHKTQAYLKAKGMIQSYLKKKEYVKAHATYVAYLKTFIPALTALAPGDFIVNNGLAVVKDPDFTLNLVKFINSL